MIMNNIDNEQWKRLSEVLELAEMSPNYFARYIGLPNGEYIYRIKRGQNGISRDVANRIAQKFPKININWLLSGEGSIFLEDSEK